MADGWLDDRRATNAFLQFGYVPGEPTLDPYLRGVSLGGGQPGDPDALADRGARALDVSFDRCAGALDGAAHVVPLSGGLDSRTILGELLDRVGRERIRTVTFGVPGTWDYDIPKRIAERFDLDSAFVPLDAGGFRWSNGLVFEHCDHRSPVPVVEKTVNHHAQELFADEDAVYWCGFNVETGAIAGQSHDTWDRAVAEFVSRNTVCTSLAEETFDPRGAVPDEPIAGTDVLPFDQQLDYALRQEYYSKPLLFPDDDVELALPFMERPWREFCLNLPPEHRKNRRMFRRILQSRYPDLFAIPVDSYGGMSLGAPAALARLKGLAHRAVERIPGPLGDPRRNYYDFDTFFARDGIEGWVAANVTDLSARAAVDWIRPTRVWDRYRSGARLGDEIRLLLSLELYFKLRERGLADRSRSEPG